MAIRKRGESWLVDVTVLGKRRYQTCKSEAEARLAEVHLELAMKGEAVASPDLVDGSWTLKKGIEEAMRLRWKGTKSEAFYVKQTDYLKAHFKESMPLSKITTEAVDDFRVGLKDKGLAQSTINHRLVALSMVFKIAHQRGGVPFKPVLGVKRAKRGRIRWVSDTEERQCLALLTQWGKQDLHDWFVVLIDTGMRPSESKKLLARDLEFKTGMLQVWDSKTEAGVRGIPMTTRVRAILERRAETYKTAPLFPYSWEVFFNAWLRLKAALKLEEDAEFVPYCLRHTFATRLVQRGVRIEVIKGLMGHESIQQTMQYAHVGAHQYAEAIKALEGAAS